MEHNRASTHLQARSDGDTRRALGREALPSEEIHIRSYDHQWAYDLDVEIRTEDGDVIFYEQYYLQPGQTESESHVLPPGEYEVRVRLDNSHRASQECRIDASPEHTALIEVGNGVFSLTEGLQS